MSPPTRFCAACGAPAIESSSHCARCGVVLASPSTPTAAVRAASAEPGRSKMPSLLIGLAACTVGGFFFLVCGGIVAGIAIPSFMTGAASSKSFTAKTNLEKIWAAEKAWAEAHDGEFLEFYVDEYEPTDANLRRLKIDVGDLTYAYEGVYDSNDVFVISAIGNIDEDDSSDEWELLSDNPVAFHLYDDIKEQEHYPDVDDEEYVEDEIVEGGVVGGTIGGIGLSGEGGGGTALGVISPADPAVETKANTARANLDELWKAQQKYKAKKKTYMAFDKGSAATWALGLAALPEAENHTFAAKIAGDSLTLSATANLDADSFEDEWSLSSADGIAIQVKNDQLNLDLTELSNVLRDLAKKDGGK